MRDTGAFAVLESPHLRRLALSMALTALASLVLAVGPGISAPNDLVQWFWEHVPPYRVLRDSHKFVALLALAYANLVVFGLQALFELASQPFQASKLLVPVGGGVLLATTIIYALPMLGPWAPLGTTEFPDDWQDARSVLDTDPGDYNVLLLP